MKRIQTLTALVMLLALVACNGVTSVSEQAANQKQEYEPPGDGGGGDGSGTWLAAELEPLDEVKAWGYVKLIESAVGSACYNFDGDVCVAWTHLEKLGIDPNNLELAKIAVVVGSKVKADCRAIEKYPEHVVFKAPLMGAGPSGLRAGRVATVFVNGVARLQGTLKTQE